MEWITDGGQALFAMIQLAVEAAPIVVPVVQGVAIGADGVALPAQPLTARQKAVAAKHTTSRVKVSNNLDDYPEDEMKKALGNAKGCSIKIRMSVERA